ncbi:MAG: PAS domain S-box protein [Actinomycetota bacterium]
MTEVLRLESLVRHPLWSASSEGLVVVDAAAAIEVANPELERLFGYEADDLIGQSVSVLIPPEAHEIHATHVASYSANPTARPMAASRLLEGQRQDGSRFPVNVSLMSIDTDQGARTVAAVRDLTLWVASERSAAEAKRQHAMADDRDRIARELHDTVIQRLFALGLGLQGLPARLDDEAVIAAVNRSVDTVDQIIGEIRSTIHGLKTPPAADVRTRQRILSLIAEMEDTLPASPRIAFIGPIDDLDAGGTVEQVLPVLREALANVARHAEATTVDVTITVSDAELVVEVVDDGRGVPTDVSRSGLANLATRAAALGGRLEIAPNEPRGTKVVWMVPRTWKGDSGSS